MGKNYTVTWKSPANIALIKYWGKHGNQLPNNPSISMTLANSCTHTTVVFKPAIKIGYPEIEFQFHGKPNDEFRGRIVQYIRKLSVNMPFLVQYDMQINSINNFPHSSGISSSASFMSSLALCLCSANQELGLFKTGNYFDYASEIARYGSGSAARSVFGGFVNWGHCNYLPNSSDHFAKELNSQVSDVFKKYSDAILVISSATKKVSSSEGHRLMEANPYSASRYTEARKNHEAMLNCLENADEDMFIKLVEHEATTLHAMLLTSDPWQILMKPNTIAVLNKVREFRHDTRIPICFTLDAGPNVHLLYNSEYSAEIKKFIDSHLKVYCENELWIDDTLGKGPELIEKTIL
jgi:diphosphomevalonate decarboxylase